MLKFLDTFSDRLINLLHLLFKSDGIIQADELMEELAITEKTLYDDFSFINDNWGDILEVHLSDNGEICAPKMSMSIFLELQSVILLETVSIKIIKSIFFHPNQKLNYHVEKLHLSSSTFYKYIHLINEELVKYDILIENNQAHYQIIGENEARLRRFFTTLFLQVSGYSSKMFLDDKLNDFLKQRIQAQYEGNEESISPNLISYYADLYFFSLLREQQGYFLETPQRFSGLKTSFSLEEFKFIEDHISVLKAEDLSRIEAFILVHHHAFNNYSDQHLNVTIPKCLEAIFETFQLSNRENESVIVNNFLKDLYLSEKFINIPLHLITNKYVYFTNEAKKNNAWAINELKHFINKLSLETSINFNFHLDYIIYVLIIHIPEIMENRLTQHVLMVSDNSKAHAKFLCERIQMELNMAPDSLQHVQCIYKEEIDKIDIHSYELIITNSISINQSFDSILINSFPVLDDIEKIKQKLII